MNILIIGLGEVGSYLAKRLSTAEGHSVTVVDPDFRRIARISEALDVKAVQGDGSHPGVLDSADADTCDLLLAVSNDDNVNMLACLFGKRIGAKRTVLRVKDLKPFAGFRTFFRKNLMFDQVLSLEALAATEIVQTIRQNKAVGVESFAEGKIQLRRLKLGEESPLLGKPVRSLKIPSGMLITAIDRDHDIIIPGGDDQCEPGDEVLVVGEPKAIATFERMTGIRSTYLRSVVMFGTSGVVPPVCEALKRLHVETRVIVPSRADAERLAEELDGPIVLHGDPSDADLLREEHVADADAFLGLSDQDEQNLMACLLARNLGVARTVALVQKPDYVPLYETLGVSVAISPRLLCADSILSFVRSGSVSTIATIEEGKAEVIELEIPAGSKLVGRTLSEAGLPRGVVVAAIARGDDEIVIPHGDTAIEALDRLVMFVLTSVVGVVTDLAS